MSGLFKLNLNCISLIPPKFEVVANPLSIRNIKWEWGVKESAEHRLNEYMLNVIRAAILSLS